MIKVHISMERSIVVLTTAATLLLLTACGGSDNSSSPTATATTAAPTATAVVLPPTATPEPTATQQAVPTATQAPAPTATTAATSGGGDGNFDDPMGLFDQELLAQGKVIFDETAGGVGCAFCHGLDGKGDGPANVGAPANRGLDLAKFEAALTDGESGAMEFLQGKLTKSQTEAVIEYIGWLGTQP
ncbi:MAG: hypothetical protein O3B95_03345 [Chloroflexi bacterium]|nr:hypothetical protein [Chloroflexota bacterium]